MKPIKEKILLILSSGLALGFTYSPNKQYKILKFAAKEWQKINERELNKEIRELYNSRLVKARENPDGSFTYVLTKKGKLKALTYQFQDMEINKSKWDGKWRVVIFDIPEKLKKSRDVLRWKLKQLEFYELQKSVFVFPYQCQDEIDFIIEFFNLRKYVRYGTLESIDNDLHLRKIFKLI